MKPLFILCLTLTLAQPIRAEDWPQFRGPGGQGFTSEKNLPIEWGGKDKKNILWQSPLRGSGHASPIVIGDRVILCTVEWPADVADKDRAKVMPAHHVTAYNAAEGKELWHAPIKPGPWLRNDFRSGAGGGYAAPTPCSDGKAIYVLFASSVLAAIDLDGKELWRQEIKPFTFDVTIGSSPILYEDTILILCAMANKKDSRLAAFHTRTGELKWETKMPTVGFAHSTPVMIDVDGKKQVLVLASGMGVTADGIQSFNPANGERLWWCKGGGDASTPAVGTYTDGNAKRTLVYFDSGRGGPGFAVDPTGKGDVSATHLKWTINVGGEAIASPVIVNDHVYRLVSGSVLKVWKCADGSQAQTERVGVSSTWASPIVDGHGRVFFASAGKSVVLDAGPPFKVLATNDLGDANHNSPAVSGGRLFLAGAKHLHCVGVK